MCDDELPEYVGGQPFPADLWGRAPIRGVAVKLVEQFIENRATSGRDFTAGEIVDALIDAGLIVDERPGRALR